MVRESLSVWLLVFAACSAAPEPSPSEAVPALDGRVERAIADVRAGAVEEGLAALESALATLPASEGSSRLEALRWSAHAHTMHGRPERALGHLDDAVVLSPGDSWLHYARGTALHTVGENELAICAYEAALERDPHHVKAAQWRAYTLALLGEYAEADDAYGEALEILDRASADELAAWGGELLSMRVWTLRARADARNALGEHAAAEADRESARALVDGE